MPENPGPSRVRIVIAGALLALLFASGTLARLYTDLLWFEDLGQRSVFVTILTSQWVTGAAFGIVFFAILYANLRIAQRMAPQTYLHAVDGPQFQFEAFLRQARTAFERYSGRAVLGVSLVLGALAGAGAATNWTVFQLALNQVSFGLADPQFGRDVSFFMFTLPAYRAAVDFMIGALLATIVLTGFMHLLTGSIKPFARLQGFAPHVKAHLSVLAGLVVLMMAAGYWIDIYELNFSGRGQVLGASFTDVNAQLPAYRILIGVALLSGLALLVNIRIRGWRLPAIALGVWFGASILLGGVYPSLVQQFRVAPNEVEAEEPYIERNIAMTREAFGLDEVATVDFPAADSLTATDVAANAATIDNVRLWDPTVIVNSYRQLQGIRQYYDFGDVDVDRYIVDGDIRQVLVSVREMDVSRLEERAQTWLNQHLIYTHGYGAIVSPVNEVSGQGLPKFIVRDIPPVSDADLRIEQPAIYFGEQTTNYVIAGSDLAEFDYPVGQEYAETSYSGATGVEVGEGMRRAAFALRFSAPQMLFSEYIRPDSKALFRRSITERIGALAPFLTLDGDPYPVIVGGRIVWVVDGYTTSSRFPYSERYEGINYIRNSVKATIDAYDGTVAIYAFDADDPVLATWSNVFPGLLTSADEMPAEIRAHLRYPEELFRIQAEVYKSYHMLNPKVFYNKEDQWAFPGEQATDGEPMKPFYVLMKLPDGVAEEFVLMIPFTPRNKDNMIGWMAVKCDPADYGERVVYAFPKQRLVLGPEQIEARLNQDPTISAQLTLWSQRGSGVIFGNMLVIPIGESIVYIQPLYLQAEQTAMPQFTRVILAHGDRVVMEPDLTTALSAVFGGEAPERPASGGGEAASAARARELYDAALEAQKAGDWAEYGRLIEQLGAELAGLAGSVEGTTVPAP
jgi:hypothetical protein